MRRIPFVMAAAFSLVSAAASAGEQDAKAIELFNGKDLSNWTWHTREQDQETKLEDVWSVEEGRILACKGRPVGYIRTKKDDYENYKLSLEWRWPEGSQGGNNGVLVHTTTPAALGVWPKSIEVQLHHGNAGDFWVIGTTLEVPDAENRRKDRRHLNLTDDSEKPIGEWNKMEVLCQGDEIKVWVNGDLVNHATDCSQTKGAISLQSEGSPIEFRNIRLVPSKKAAGG